MEKYFCTGCEKPFQNGELIVYNEKQMYHHIVYQEGMTLIDCMTRDFLKDKFNGVEGAVVFYKDKLYELQIGKLPNVKDLLTALNPERTGCIIAGYLEDLVDFEECKF